MQLTMSFSEASQVTVHAVLAGHLCALGEVIDYLIASQGLIGLSFDVWRGPGKGPLLVSLCAFTKAIIFKCVSDKSHVDAVIKLEKVPFILWLVRSEGHRVDVGPEDEILLSWNCIYGLVLLKSLIKCKVKLAWLMLDDHLVDVVQELSRLNFVISSSVFLHHLMVESLYLTHLNGLLNLMAIFLNMISEIRVLTFDSGSNNMCLLQCVQTNWISASSFH